MAAAWALGLWLIALGMFSVVVVLPIEGPFVMPEEEVARSLVVLAGNDQVIIRRALSLLDDGEALGRAHAHRRLAHAECLAAGEQSAGRRKSG